MRSKLLCIDDSIKADQIEFVCMVYPQWVKKGEQYTVRQVLENDGIVTGVLLEEVKNEEIFQQLLGRYQEPAFRMSRFVEITECEHSVYSSLEFTNFVE
jgi:tRNA uridine 5-carbamoylmethylation protein Kti12